MIRSNFFFWWGKRSINRRLVTATGSANAEWLVNYLLNWRLCLEKNSPAQQLGEYAADRPHVDGGVVVAGAHQKLWRPVVLGHHLLSHIARLVFLHHSGQSEVTNLEKTEREQANSISIDKLSQQLADEVKSLMDDHRSTLP